MGRMNPMETADVLSYMFSREAQRSVSVLLFPIATSPHHQIAKSPNHQLLHPVDPAHPVIRSRMGAMPTVYLETFGCQMNVLDSQLVQSQLTGLGYRFIDDWRDADVVLYNTCSVREGAENKVWSRVGIVGEHKRERPSTVLGVIGCMAERDGTDMVRRHPQIDLLCGPGELNRLPMLIDNAVRTDPARRGGVDAAGVALSGDTHRRSSTLAAAEDELELLDLSRSFSATQDGAAPRSAYVRITRGCNKFCTYCVVPHTRGAEVHRPPEHIIDEVRRLVDNGTVEVTLLGQTVNHYHYDDSAAVSINGVMQPQIGSIINHHRRPGSLLPGSAAESTTTDTTTTFAHLLARIHDEVPDLHRLRFVTSFPRDFGDDILATIRDRPRICRYLHLPVQSGSDRILKSMNRGYTVAEYDDLLRRVREYLPDATIATDIITGFPTETEEDHAATCDLLRRAGFKNSFVFKYSPRPGTAAIGRYKDDVDDAIKRRRNAELLAIQNDASERVHAGYVGREVEVFVEGVSSRTRKLRNAAAPGAPAVHLGWERHATGESVQLTGRTGGDLITLFDGPESLIGSIAKVAIQDSTPLSLMGDSLTG